jgi:hypothetical protein
VRAGVSILWAGFSQPTQGPINSWVPNNSGQKTFCADTICAWLLQAAFIGFYWRLCLQSVLEVDWCAISGTWGCVAAQMQGVYYSSTKGCYNPNGLVTIATLVLLEQPWLR